jgi:glycosyltransferase involved in cell wall biosynthesis
VEGRHLIEVPYIPARKFPLLRTVAEEYFFNLAARNWLLTHQTEFDIIHLQGRSGNLFLKDKRQIKVPVVTTLHGLISIEYQHQSNRFAHPLDRKIHRSAAERMEKFALQNSDALIAVSQEVVTEIERRNLEWKAKTKLIYNGIDLADFEYIKKISLPSVPPQYLLFVGRLSAIKGVFPLLEAMKLVHSSIHLVMVGDGDARPELERLILENNLSNRISLMGAQSGECVANWLQNSYALILPSFYETQGIVLMEANICGKPVIATAVGGVPEVVEHGRNGLLVPSHEPSTIAKSINYLYDNPTLAQNMGKWGKNYDSNRTFLSKNHQRLSRQTPNSDFRHVRITILFKKL